MAPQSLDLGLSLGLGLAALQPSFCYSGNAAAAAAEREASPTAAEERERRCSPAGSPVSSGSGSGGKRAAAERSAGAGSGSGDEDDDGAARKKLRLSKDQAAVLEECFKTHSTLNPKQKVALANRLGLRPRQVEVWFQNRRARTKLKQTEVDCEYLKRWCERLADENKRLEKELADLRALKAAPSPAAQPASPAATLTMCPSCRRVAAAGAPANHQQQCHPKSNAAVAAANVVPSHCQFFPAAVDRTGQSTWNAASAAAPLVTRELF
jgi:homeobox-leucine zipper protein